MLNLTLLKAIASPAQLPKEVTDLLEPYMPLINENKDILLPVGAAVVGLLVILMMKKIMSASEGTPPPTPHYSSGGSVTGRQAVAMVKSAKKLAADGDHLGAAENFRAAGEKEEAARAYKRARQPAIAAELYLEMKKPAAAAEAFSQAGNFDRAGELFKIMRDYRRAAEAYTKGNNMTMAAEMFEFAGDPNNAAEAYEKSKNYRKAGELFSRTDKLEKAAVNLRKAFLAERGRLTMPAVKEDEKANIKDLAYKSGILYSKIGKNTDALMVLEDAQLFDRAAEIAEKSGNLEKAADYYQRAKMIDEAIKCFMQMGDKTRAETLRAEMLSERGDASAAAEAYARAGDFLEAAEKYRLIDEFVKAAEMYIKHEDFNNAAEMYKKAKDIHKAADALARGQNFRGAAEIYMNLGNWEKQSEMLEKGGFLFEAGKNYFVHQRHSEAADILQKIEKNHPHFRAACSLLGDIFKEKGMMSLAVQKYQLAIDGQKVNTTNFHPYYNLAVVLETQEGKEKIAMAIYKSIIKYDPNYSDAAERHEKLRAMLEPPTKEKEAEKPTEPTPEAAPPAPKKPGRYSIIDEIGRGGMGIVYKAKENLLDRFVAFKVLQSNLNENDLAVRNFIREAKSAAALNHPNIVTVYDAGEEEGTYYIAMEFIEGMTLRQIMRRTKKPLDLPLFFEIALQLCDAMNYAHSLGVIHRDIKSSNIMWDENQRRVKIMDFGLAKVIQEVVNYQTVVGGTPHYMSPEQILGEATDHRADIYSLGVTFFELSVGNVPFKKGDVGYHHIHTPPPLAHESKAELTPEYSQIIVKCMAKDKKDRYQSAGEIKTDLEKVKPAILKA